MPFHYVIIVYSKYIDRLIGIIIAVILYCTWISDANCDATNPKYIGCYSDDGNRDLEKGPMKYGYNLKTCNEACKTYKYFALQNGGCCVCGDAYATEAQYVQKPDRECNRGSGGVWRNSVYRTCQGYDSMRYE